MNIRLLGITFRLGNAQEEFAAAPVYTALRLPIHTQKTEYSYDWKAVRGGGGGGGGEEPNIDLELSATTSSWELRKKVVSTNVFALRNGMILES